MKKTCLKFLPVFLISVVCLIASIGFVGVNALAENCDSVNNEGYTVTFKAHPGYGSIKGPTEYSFYSDSSIISEDNELTLKIFRFGTMSTIEIKAIGNAGHAFVNWTRSDGKDFNADISTDVEFRANFTGEADFHIIKFSADNKEAGSIYGPAEYQFDSDCSYIASSANDPKLRILEHNTRTTEITAVPHNFDDVKNFIFDYWSRSDGKDFNAEISSDVEFVAHFRVHVCFYIKDRDIKYGCIDHDEVYVPFGAVPKVDQDNRLIIGDKIITPSPKTPEGDYINRFDAWKDGSPELFKPIIGATSISASFSPYATVSFSSNNDTYGKIVPEEPHTETSFEFNIKNATIDFKDNKVKVAGHTRKVADHTFYAKEAEGDYNIGYKFVDWTSPIKDKEQIKGNIKVIANFVPVPKYSINASMDSESKDWGVLVNNIPERLSEGSYVTIESSKNLSCINAYSYKGEFLGYAKVFCNSKTEDYQYIFKSWSITNKQGQVIPSQEKIYIDQDLNFSANISRVETDEVTVHADSSSMEVFALSFPKGCKWHIEKAYTDERGFFIPTTLVVVNNQGESKGCFRCIDRNLGEFDKAFFNGAEIHEGDYIMTNGILSAKYNK